MFQINRQAFQTIKLQTFKNTILNIFSKGLSHDFCQKFENFYFVVFRQNKPKKVFANVVDRQKSFSGYKKYRLLKNAFIGIFPKGLTHAFCQKFEIFSFFVCRQKNLDEVFAMFNIDRKAFHALKISTFKKKANIFSSFPTGLTHDFFHKFEIFPSLFFVNINLEKVITDVLDRQMPFLAFL